MLILKYNKLTTICLSYLRVKKEVSRCYSGIERQVGPPSTGPTAACTFKSSYCYSFTSESVISTPAERTRPAALD